jgi:hypothetical protein
MSNQKTSNGLIYATKDYLFDFFPIFLDLRMIALSFLVLLVELPTQVG